MASFRFKLNRVLEYREQVERLAEVTQQHALAAVTAIQAEVAGLQQLLDQGASEPRGRLGRVATVSSWLASYQQSQRLDRQLHEARTRLLEAERRRQEASDALRKRSVEAETLRKLREQAHAAHQRGLARTSEIFLDEIGLRLWREQSSGGLESNEGDES